MVRSRVLFCLCVVFLVAWVLPHSASAGFRDGPPLSSKGHVRPENRFFEVSPRIVPADVESTVEIVPLFDHCRFKEDCTYELTYAPTEEIAVKSGWTAGKMTGPIVPENGRYGCKMLFEGEQEHVLYIVEVNKKNEKRLLGDFRVYSLGPDLFKLRPFKGDFHMHSNRSDGVEPPGYVAGACRRVGLDFMALTDHRCYAGSVEAQKAFQDVEVALRIYNGEECHPPGNPAHTVSFGASSGISELYADEAGYRAEVKQVEDALPALPAGVDRFQYASCVWEYNKIRERGGLAIFCHHYWFTSHRFSPGGALTACLFENQPFDVLELVSGMDTAELLNEDTLNLQVAHYNEARAQGKKVPICGISDTHGCENSETFGRYYTVVFAPSSDLADVQAAIKDLRSVAVETRQDDLPRAYGPFRLVKYAHFLLREIFPQHDEMCFEEGRLMIKHVAGDATAAGRLKELKGQTSDFMKKCWKD